MNPQPKVFPQCSECKTAFVLRRAIVFSGRNSSRPIRLTNEWVWQRDCKHRKAAPEVAKP